MTGPEVGLTPDPEANAFIDAYRERVRAVLDRDLIGLLVHGSIATGTFDAASDIDIIAIIGQPLTGEQFAALDAMHRALQQLDTSWAIQLEVTYIPLASLRRYDPDDATHPHIDRGPGEQLKLKHFYEDWKIQRHLMREKGIMLFGPPPETVIDPVNQQEVREAAWGILQIWLEVLPDEIEAYEHRGAQSYAVLTLCRSLHTIATGLPASKKQSLDWAREALAPRCKPLLDDAWDGRTNHQSAVTPALRQETMAFARYALSYGQGIMEAL